MTQIFNHTKHGSVEACFLRFLFD